MVMMPLCHPNMCGKEFRKSVKRPSPIGKTARKSKRIRNVPAFTYQALQKNTLVLPPPYSGIYRPAPPRYSKFHIAYLKDQLPFSINFCPSPRIIWRIPPEKLDLCYYLPILITGLSENTMPFDFLASEALKDIIRMCGNRVLPSVPLFVTALQEAMRTKRPDVMIKTMECIQRLCEKCKNVGRALVAYYRMILPIMNIFLVKGREISSYDEPTPIVYPEKDVIYMIESTLHTLEIYGGPDAFLNIKYYVPIYESVLQN